jgi:hypothetical protein
MVIRAPRVDLGTLQVEGWSRVGEVDGVPLWQWQQDWTVRVATPDDDILRVIGAALNYCDKLSVAESDAFIAEHLPGGRSGTYNTASRLWVVDVEPSA